jgi:hypothetical protein
MGGNLLDFGIFEGVDLDSLFFLFCSLSDLGVGLAVIRAPDCALPMYEQHSVECHYDKILFDKR